jgi:uncharacterized protein (DUF1501 family)
MTLDRRNFLKHAGVVSLAGLGATLARVADVHAADYKALVVVFLSGGHDGNNLLVPMDGAYNDYAKARPSLALAKDSLVPLQGSHIGHKFGLSGASRDLRTLFEQQKLAIVANVGALVQPTTLAQVRNNTAKLPPFLGSHTEQEQWIQGWMGDEDLSGWGGRALDAMPQSLKNKQPLISLARDYTAVLGNETPLSLANSNGSSNWGRTNLQNTNDLTQKRLEWLSRMQSGNAFEAEFSRSMRVAYLDSLEFAKGQQSGPDPTGMFPDMQIGKDLRFVAKHMPYSKQTGARRQVYLVQDGGYDTHTGQLSTDPGNPGLEIRFNDVVSSLMGFDQSMHSLGMQDEVVTIVLSEFGRTLDPASGIGSDHAWGNHWFVMGGPVKGGVIYGDSFPTLQTGGPDDASLWDPKRGQWLPQFSSDQFIADTLQWMGLTPAQTLEVLPNLANFSRHKIGYL